MWGHSCLQGWACSRNILGCFGVGVRDVRRVYLFTIGSHGNDEKKTGVGCIVGGGRWFCDVWREWLSAAL